MQTMNTFFKSVKIIFKRGHKIIGLVINFIFIIPMYFIGAGMSRIFYVHPKEEPNQKSYWKESKLNYNKKDFEKLF